MQRGSRVIRIAAVLASFAGILALYGITCERSARVGDTVANTAIDRWIGVTPIWILPYLSYYPILLLIFLLSTRNPEFWRLFLESMIVALAGLGAFVLMPTSIERGGFSTGEVFGEALMDLRRLDPPGNCLPSMHVSLSVWAGYVALACGYWRWSWVVAWILAMSLAAIGTGQHGIVDVLAGLGAGSAGVIASRQVSRSRCTAGANPESDHARDSRGPTRGLGGFALFVALVVAGTCVSALVPRGLGLIEFRAPL